MVAATSKIALPTIQSLQDLGHQLTIATMPDRPAGRGLKLKPSEIGEIFPEAIRIHSEQELQELVSESDLLITIAFGRILQLQTLQIPKFGGINLHFSLLPRWRGAAPVQRAIEFGDEITGVSVFQMDAGMDTGPIWVQKSFEIPPEFTAVQLFESLSLLGSVAITQTLDLITSGSSPTPQVGPATIAKKISKSETHINWRDDALQILRKIRALTPNPGAFTNARKEPLKILNAELTSEKLEPGVFNQLGLVGTGSNALKLLEVKPSGKRVMSASEWLNGFRPQLGEKFE